MIVGDVVDTYDGAGGRTGKPPEADPSREYISGGGSNFPLMSQQVLTQSVDDLASDLGPQVYEVMLNDSTVSSAVAILITGALSGEFQLVARVRAEEHEVVEPGSDRADTIELSHYYRDFCQRNIDRLGTPIKLICHELLYAMVYGCKLAEVTYEMGVGEDAGKLVVKVIRTKRNRAWNFVVEPTGDVVAIRALTMEGGYRDLPPEKFLVVTWMPRDGDPRGRSILRPAYNPWNLKINLWPKYFKYLEKFGCPTIVGMTAPGASAEPELSDDGRPTGRSLTAEEAMAQMLARLDGGSYAAITNGASIHPIQPNNNGNAFLQAFNLFKTEILEGIIINARGVIAAAHTSKADNDSAKDTVGQITLYAREILEDAFRDQLFWNLICLNGGKEHADLYTPHVSLGEAEHQDIAALATAYNLIGYQADPSQFPAIDAKLGLPVRTLQETDAHLPDGVTETGP